MDKNPVSFPDTSSWAPNDWLYFLKSCPYTVFCDFFEDNPELAWLLGDYVVQAERAARGHQDA